MAILKLQEQKHNDCGQRNTQSQNKPRKKPNLLKNVATMNDS